MCFVSFGTQNHERGREGQTGFDTRSSFSSSPSLFHPVKRFDIWLLDTFRQRLRALSPAHESKLIRFPDEFFIRPSLLPSSFFFRRSLYLVDFFFFFFTETNHRRNVAVYNFSRHATRIFEYRIDISFERENLERVGQNRGKSVFRRRRYNLNCTTTNLRIQLYQVGNTKLPG